MLQISNELAERPARFVSETSPTIFLELSLNGKFGFIIPKAPKNLVNSLQPPPLKLYDEMGLGIVLILWVPSRILPVDYPRDLPIFHQDVPQVQISMGGNNPVATAMNSIWQCRVAQDFVERILGSERPVKIPVGFILWNTCADTVVVTGPSGRVRNLMSILAL